MSEKTDHSESIGKLEVEVEHLKEKVHEVEVVTEDYKRWKWILIGGVLVFVAFAKTVWHFISEKVTEIF